MFSSNRIKTLCFTLCCISSLAIKSEAAKRPNILLAISDDQSYPYSSIYGSKAVETPAFDRIAREGALFTNGFCASPGCSPSRAALLTGRHTWQIEHAGTHASSFPAKYVTYPDMLEQAGYFVGYTGKGWGPGNFKIDGRKRNPAGPSFSKKKTKSPQGISSTDYAANFADFLEAKPDDTPFCFWYGDHEPHRSYLKNAGIDACKNLADVHVPSFLPDRPEIRSDLLDYCVEIEWFDKHLGLILRHLAEKGELENTLILVTADNGMPFPRAKDNCYEYGIHAPWAVRWPGKVKAGRVVDDLVGFVDIAPTFLEAAGLEPSKPMPGKSLMNILNSPKSGIVDAARTKVFSARERHSSSRWGNLTYPIRAMRTHEYLYIRNFRPERWPAGAPQKFDKNGSLGPAHGGYHDIDACPSLTFLIENMNDKAIRPYFELSVSKRPGEELYNIKLDPGCIQNLVSNPKYEKVLANHRLEFEKTLRETGDPRILSGGDIFETYKRYNPIRKFPKPE